MLDASIPSMQRIKECTAMSIYSIPFYVYKITCLVTNQYYFGSRCHHVKKNKKPENDLWIKYFTSSNVVKNLIEIHGKGSFKPEIIYNTFSRDDAFWVEQDFIKSHYGDPNLLNAYYIDQKSSNKVWGWTDDNIAIRTAKIKEHVANGTHNFLGGHIQRRAQLRRLAEGTHTSQDPVWLEKIRKIQASEETRRRKSISLKAYNQTQVAKDHRDKHKEKAAQRRSATVKKYYQDNPDKKYNNGIKAANTAEANAQKSASHLFKNRTQGTKPWFMCENTGEIFCNLRAASKALNVSPSGIGLVLNGYFSKMKGLTFRYLNEEEVTDYLNSPQYQSLVQLYKPPS
jgi:hypothetical protein